MSSYAVHETEISLEDLARDINSDFQFVADRVPRELKTGPAGVTQTLSHIEGLGRLTATYMGQRYQREGEPKCQFVVKVMAVAEDYGGMLGFSKEYGLSYATARAEGPLLDLEPTTPEQLEDCPDRIALAFTIQSLREEFARQRGIELENTAQLAQLDSYRVA